MEEMLPEVYQAALTLEAFEQSANRVVDRREVVAYAVLTAWVTHWPARSTAKERLLVEQTKIIREREPDRFLKQRRIALSQLAERLDSHQRSAQQPHPSP